MKKIFVPYILSVLLLTACGQFEVQSPTLDSDIPVIANSGIENKVSEQVQTTPPDGVKLEISEPVGVYEKVYVRDVISYPGVQLRNGSQGLDTSKTGENEVAVSYIYDGKRYEYPVSYTVEDTAPPVLLRSGNGAVAVLGEPFDLNDYVGFADNYDRKPKLTYTGEVDTSTVGVYSLTATATDSSGNETTWDLDINVESEEAEYVDNNTRIPFEEFISDYEGENRVFGIDVSRWQYEIDFEAVKDAGCEFVFIRVGSFYDEYTVDTYFESNMEKAAAAGLKTGVYIYTTANTEEEIKENAHWIAEQLDGRQLDLPVVFDWEEFSGFQKYEMSINDLNNYYEIFSKEIQKYGYDSMLYSSKNFLENFWYKHMNTNIWLAHFTDETDYDGNYSIWQATCFGNIDGIDGDVDFNILYTDKANFYN